MSAYSRSQIILLAVEQRLVAHEIGALVRPGQQTVCHSLKRYLGVQLSWSVGRLFDINYVV